MSLPTSLHAVAGRRMAAMGGSRGIGAGALNEGVPPGAPVD